MFRATQNGMFLNKLVFLLVMPVLVLTYQNCSSQSASENLIGDSASANNPEEGSSNADILRFEDLPENHINSRSTSFKRFPVGVSLQGFLPNSCELRGATTNIETQCSCERTSWKDCRVEIRSADGSEGPFEVEIQVDYKLSTVLPGQDTEERKTDWIKISGEAISYSEFPNVPTSGIVYMRDENSDTFSINLNDFISDVDSQKWAFEIVDETQNGSISLDGLTGEVTYQRDALDIYYDYFTFYATDDEGSRSSLGRLNFRDITFPPLKTLFTKDNSFVHPEALNFSTQEINGETYLMLFLRYNQSFNAKYPEGLNEATGFLIGKLDDRNRLIWKEVFFARDSSGELITSSLTTFNSLNIDESNPNILGIELGLRRPTYVFSMDPLNSTNQSSLSTGKITIEFNQANGDYTYQVFN